MAGEELKEHNVVSEEERQIEGYHKALHALFKGSDDIITARACASFIGCTMAHSEEWKRLIPGFMNEIMAYADVAIAAHRMAETITQPEVTTGEKDGCTKEG